MKSLKISAFGVIVLLFMVYSCKDEPLLPKDCLNCEFSAVLDSVTWDAHVTHCYLFEHLPGNNDTTFSFFVEENNPIDGTPDQLSFSWVPAFPGHYKIVPGTIPLEMNVESSLAARKYSGQTIETFITSDSLESFIEVEFFSLATREWRVNFHLELTLNGAPWVPSQDSIYPRNFSITNGFAKGEIPE